MLGYSADEITDMLRRDYVHMTSRELSLSREDRDILMRLVRRTALEVAARVVEMNNLRLADQLKVNL